MSQLITTYHWWCKNKVTKSDSLFCRLNQLRLHHGWTWARVGEVVGVKTAMIMMVKSGDRSLSDKALYRLTEAERAAGLTPPADEPDISRVQESPDTVAEWKRRALVAEKKLAELEAAIDALRKKF